MKLMSFRQNHSQLSFSMNNHHNKDLITFFTDAYHVFELKIKKVIQERLFIQVGVNFCSIFLQNDGFREVMDYMHPIHCFDYFSNIEEFYFISLLPSVYAYIEVNVSEYSNVYSSNLIFNISDFDDNLA